MWRLARVCATVAWFGCGGAERSGTAGQDDGGRGGGSDDSGPSTCPGQMPIAGESCAAAGTSCRFGECTACLCVSSGLWTCENLGTDCASCPAQVVNGAACPAGLTCAQVGFCGTRCACQDGVWDCPPCAGGSCGNASMCFGDVDCPSAKPEEGADCAASADRSCGYPWSDSCSEALCACVSGGWTCSYVPACADAGS